MIDARELGARLRHRRLGLGLPLRKAAQAAGVSAATFSRVERGNHVPDPQNLMKLATWAGVELDELRTHERRPIPEMSASTPEAVALHLRADPSLSEEDAEMLAAVFRAAYAAVVSRVEG
jgi:transcriptional regulator with XRE-family HTH domain